MKTQYNQYAFLITRKLGLEAELRGKKIIIQPNSPSEGLIVAFVEVDGAPVELMEYERFEKKYNHYASIDYETIFKK